MWRLLPHCHGSLKGSETRPYAGTSVSSGDKVSQSCWRFSKGAQPCASGTMRPPSHHRGYSTGSLASSCSV